MTSLQQRIQQMEGGIPAVHSSAAGSGNLPDDLHFLRVLGVGDFRQSPGGLAEYARRHEELFAGFAAAGQPFALFIDGQTPGQMAFHLGVQSPGGTSDAWAHQLRSVFPNCETGEALAAQDVLPRLQALPWMGTLLIPPAQSFLGGPQASFVRSRLEAAWRMYSRARWAFLLWANPVPLPAVKDQLAVLNAEDEECRRAYLRRGTSEESNHPEAQHLLELLGQARTRWRHATCQGLWEVRVLVCADDPDVLADGTRSLAGVIAPEEAAGPEIRVWLGQQPATLSLERFPCSALTTKELVTAARLPTEELPGFQLLPATRFSEQTDAPAPGDTVAIGLRESGHGWSELPLSELTKHVLVVGATGAGKTATCFQMLLQLWNEHRVPFLVIEPAMKREYRGLLRSTLAVDLRIFTVGDESVAPLRLNPLAVSPGIHVEAHLSSLMALFKASFSWVSPMPEILERALHQLYEEFGWDMEGGSHPRRDEAGAHPRLTHLLEIVERVTHSSGYDGELRGNIRAGVYNRLWKLTRGANGRMFDTGDSRPFAALMERPTVLELATLGDEEESAFFMGLILIKLTQHLQHTGATGGELRHVTLVEEAHRLLAEAPPAAHADAGNARARAVAGFCNLIAEVRAFGEGLIIAEQSPARLARDILRNTHTKIVHRLSDQDDRDLVGTSIGLDASQTEHVQRLQPGKAILHRGGGTGAVLVSIPNVRRQFGPGGLPDNLEIARHMQGHLPQSAKDPAPATKPRPAASQTQNPQPQPLTPGVRLCGHCDAMGCRHQDRITNGLVRLQAGAQFAHALRNGHPALRRFGAETAAAIYQPAPPPPEAAECVVLNLVASSGALTPDGFANFCRNFTNTPP